MSKLILLTIIITLLGFIFFLTRKISRLKLSNNNWADSARASIALLEKEEQKAYQNCLAICREYRHGPLGYNEYKHLSGIENNRVSSLRAQRKELEANIHQFELNKLKMVTAVELHNILCNLIMSDPYLRDLLMQSKRDQAVVILKNSANLSQDQFEENKTTLFQVVDTVKALQPVNSRRLTGRKIADAVELQPVNPVLYKEAN